MRRFAGTASFIFYVGLFGAQATGKELWEKTAPPLDTLGVDFVVCKDIPDEVICLGLGCASGSARLVSMRSGSGAFGGNVKVTGAGGAFQAHFSDYDEKLGAAVGASGSRATITREQLEALTRASRITIFDPKENFTESYSTKGLKALVAKAKGACAAPEH
jgi:hypothetical protein